MKQSTSIFLVIVASLLLLMYLVPPVRPVAAQSCNNCSAQNVTWTNVTSNITVTGNSLQKTSGCDGCADAGAISQQTITSGDGYIEFTASETNTYRYIGLSTDTSATPSYVTINFGFEPSKLGEMDVREGDGTNSNYRADTTYAAGDVFRVGVESGVINYYKKPSGSSSYTLIYTSLLAPSYPLVARACLLTANSTINNVVFGSAPCSAQASWTEVTSNLTVTGNSLQKTSGCDGCADAGAISQQSITSGNGYLEFTASETDTYRYIGLSTDTSATPSYVTINFGFAPSKSGEMDVREGDGTNSNYRTDTTYAAGDVFKVAIESGVINYYKEPSGSSSFTLIYTSSLAPVYPLVARACLLTANSTVDDVVLSCNSSGPSLTQINATGVTASGALITWLSSSAGDTQVNYGTTSSYGSSSPLDSRQVTSHNVYLTGLSPSTTYHFQVDTSGTASGDFTFTTPSQGNLPSLPSTYIDTTYPDTTSYVVKTVKATGGDYSLSQLQTAINAAAADSSAAGYVIKIQAGQTVTGQFTLPSNLQPAGSTAANAKWIIITSDSSSIPDAGVRATSSDAPNMARIVSNESEGSVFNAAAGVAITRDGSNNITGGVAYYRLVGLECTVSDTGASKNDKILYLGYGDSTQNASNLVPQYLTVDRCYVHGNSLGDYRGIYINAAFCSVIDSTVTECHDEGADEQAILMLNTPGPVKIVNNELEGAGENTMSGGSTPGITGEIPSDIEFRLNHLDKPLNWKTGVVPQPTGVSAADSATSGSLAPGTTYYYRVVGQGYIGFQYDVGTSGTTAYSNSSTETSWTLGSGKTAATITWNTDQYGSGTLLRNVNNYLIYRTTDPPTAGTRNWTYYLQAGTSGSTQTFTDIGASGTQTTRLVGVKRWVTKNTCEWKCAKRVLIDSNVIEDCWPPDQSGWILSLKSENQDNQVPWASTQDITVTNNILRHGNIGVLVFAGGDNPIDPSQFTQRVLIVNNLFDDLNGDTWTDAETGAAASGQGIRLTAGTGTTSNSFPNYVDIEHNTFLNSAQTSGLDYGLFADDNQFSSFSKAVGFILRNNIIGYNHAGFRGNGEIGYTSVAGANMSRPDVNYDMWGNGTDSSGFPATNLFESTWAAVDFVNYSSGNGGDYHLQSSSPGFQTASDGTDRGANIDSVNNATANSLGG